MKRNRLIIALIIIAVMVPAIFACSNEVDSKTDDVLDNSQESEMETEKNTSELDDGLSGLDFGGRPFNIYAYGQQPVCILEFYGEEENADTINDAVYKRNMDVETRLNVKFNIVYSDEASGSVGAMAKTNVMAGDHSYDLYLGHIMRMGQTVLENVFIDLYDLQYIDFTKPWWNQSAVENLSYKEHAYLMVGDVNFSALLAAYGVFFNKSMLEDYGMSASDLYQTVLDGKWTIDKQTEFARLFTRDLDGDGTITTDDQLGLTTTTGFASSAYLWGSGQQICVINNDGVQELNLPNENFNTIVDKIYELYYGSYGVNAVVYNDEDWTNATQFRNNKTFMINHYLYTALRLRDLETDFGILPYPMLDENQDKYYSVADGFHTGLAVPITAATEDYGFIGAVIEELNVESYNTVVPAYYDIALKIKGARDDESVAVMDMIRDGLTFDFGCVYDGWTGFAFAISDLMQQKSTNFESYYAKKEIAAQNYFEKVINCFELLVD